MRKRIQFETTVIKLSDIKLTEGVFISDRKVERFAAQFQGTLPVSTEPHGDWTEAVRFLASLIVALTSRARFDAHHQDATLKTAVAPQGVVELIRYASTNLKFRLNNPGSPATWSLEDVLLDLGECAKLYGLQDFLDDSLAMVGR
jgi:hypothetical protein